MAATHTILLKVHPSVYDFYRCVYKSDTIHLSSNSIFYEKIIGTLDVAPVKYRNSKVKKQKTLKLVLPAEVRRGNKHPKTTNKEISDRHQEMISRELYYLFKDIFHNYVLGYCTSQRGANGCQKKGILDFCFSYKIDDDTMNYEMLKKSWDRSEQKKMLLETV